MLQWLYVFALSIFVFIEMTISMREFFPQMITLSSICSYFFYTLEMTFLEVTPHPSQPLWPTVYNTLTVEGLYLFYLVLIQNLFEFEAVPLTQSSSRNGKETGLG